MWGVDKMKIRWTNQAEEQQAEVFLEKGRATPENFRKLGKKRGGDCRIVVKKEGFSEEEWIHRCQRIYQQERGSGKRRGDSGSVPAGSKTVVLLPGNPIHRLWL